MIIKLAQARPGMGIQRLTADLCRAFSALALFLTLT